MRFKVADTPVFETKQEQTYRQEIESRIYRITYVMNGWGLEPDFVAFGIKEVSA